MKDVDEKKEKINLIEQKYKKYQPGPRQSGQKRMKSLAPIDSDTNGKEENINSLNLSKKIPQMQKSSSSSRAVAQVKESKSFNLTQMKQPSQTKTGFNPKDKKEQRHPDCKISMIGYDNEDDRIRT